MYLVMGEGGEGKRRRKNYVKYSDPVLKIQVHTGEELYHIFDSFYIAQSKGLPYV